MTLKEFIEQTQICLDVDIRDFDGQFTEGCGNLIFRSRNELDKNHALTASMLPAKYLNYQACYASGLQTPPLVIYITK